MTSLLTLQSNHFIKKTFSNKKYHKNSKAWFGPRCRNARVIYNTARKNFNINKTQENKNILNQSSKDYKHTMNHFIQKNKFENETKLRQMSRSKPKDYWKFLNSLKQKTNQKHPPLEELYQHFKTMNTSTIDESDTTEPDINIQYEDEILNCPITVTEIEKMIKKTKNMKAPGNDFLINEYFKSSITLMLPIYCLLFNKILDTGIMPDSWLEGSIMPIFKNKGSPLSPENYRPITLLSCLGKLFTSILNDRLTHFLDENWILSENQAGFRHKYSTLDHIYSLNFLIEMIRSKKNKLFCSYIDFSRAFDSVWRSGLWSKIIHSGINGKFIQVIKNMYSNIKSSVALNGQQSMFFPSEIGVRQGENLSPVLFSLFLNDLEDFLVFNNNNGITLHYNQEEVSYYLQILVLLYADDTVIISDSAESFQKCLNDFYTYCQHWKLNINLDKTKVIVFGSNKRSKYAFKLGSTLLETVDQLLYFHHLEVS